MIIGLISLSKIFFFFQLLNVNIFWFLTVNSKLYNFALLSKYDILGNTGFFSFSDIL